MTNAQAKTRAKKQFGSSFYIRAGESLSSPERREQARATVKQANDRIKEIDDEIRRRLEELDWFRELTGEKRGLRKTISKTEGNAFYYRFSVGTQNGSFAAIAGTGDTWEEAFAQAEAKS